MVASRTTRPCTPASRAAGRIDRRDVVDLRRRRAPRYRSGRARSSGRKAGRDRRARSAARRARSATVPGGRRPAPRAPRCARSTAAPAAPARPRCRSFRRAGRSRTATVPGVAAASFGPGQAARRRPGEHQLFFTRCSPASSENRRNSGSKPGVLTARLYSPGPRSKISKLPSSRPVTRLADALLLVLMRVKSGFRTTFPVLIDERIAHRRTRGLTRLRGR